MTFPILLAAAALAGIAAAGVLRPYGKPRAVTLERLADPLEDERLSLLRAVRDLEEERASGVLGDEDYQALRSETETRAVAVLRALEARDGAGELAAGLKEFRSPPGAGPPSPDLTSTNGERRTIPPGRRAWLPVVVAGGISAAVIVPLLMGSIGKRATDQPITGGAGGETTLAFFQQRVAQHPQDVAARLDLAQAYIDSSDLPDAVKQFEAVLAIDPGDPEARASLGFVLYLGGRPGLGLREVNTALAAYPADPQALYFKGIILLRGLSKPREAAAAFQAYLEATPLGGSHTDEVRRLLQQARSEPAP
jgi:tetratricopeptide (TPR) repeat protein